MSFEGIESGGNALNQLPNNNFEKLIDRTKTNINNLTNYPKIIEENPDGTITVTIFGIGEKGLSIERKLTVSTNDIRILKSNKLPRIKKIFENELGGKLDKFIKNKIHRKALYYTFISLSKGKSYNETIKETAFYIKELY